MVGFVALVYNLYKEEDIMIYLLGMHVPMSGFVYTSKHMHENMVGTDWLSLNCDPTSLEPVLLTLAPLL